MKDQNKTPEKEMEVDKQSDAEFKTLVIGLPKELTEYGKSIREEMKATLSKIKKNPQGNNNEGKEAGIQIHNLEHKEEINIQPEQNEDTRIKKKNEERIRRLWDISQGANISIIEMPEVEEEEQEIKTYLKK